MTSSSHCFHLFLASHRRPISVRTFCAIIKQKIIERFSFMLGGVCQRLTRYTLCANSIYWAKWWYHKCTLQTKFPFSKVMRLKEERLLIEFLINFLNWKVFLDRKNFVSEENFNKRKKNFVCLLKYKLRGERRKSFAGCTVKTYGIKTAEE